CQPPHHWEEAPEQLVAARREQVGKGSRNPRQKRRQPDQPDRQECPEGPLPGFVVAPCFTSSMAATISPRPAPSWPSMVAARSSVALCWLNLRVPRISLGSTSNQTIALTIASTLPGSIFARVQGWAGES